MKEFLTSKRGKISALVAGVLLCCLVGYLAFGSEKKEQAVTQPPLVKTVTLGAADGTSSTYSGTVRGRYETNLSFQVGGRILARNVEVGSRVSPGDVLMVIDARDVEQQANQGDAAVASASAQLKLAQANLGRYTELYHEAAVPKAVLDQYQTSYDAAFAAYQNALAQSAEGHNAVGYTNLTANAAGVISSLTAEQGQVVAAGQTVATLVQTGELEIEINVPENALATVPVGQEVTVNFWALSGSVRGVVREVAPMADSAARTYRVRVSLPEPPAGLELGMTASVEVTGEADGDTGMVFPLAALYQQGDTPGVWVVEDGAVSLKSVTVDSFDKNSVRVHGLPAGTVVVTAGVHRLTEGQQVRTEDDSATSAEAAQ